jgi:hypothetical protein
MTPEFSKGQSSLIPHYLVRCLHHFSPSLSPEQRLSAIGDIQTLFCEKDNDKICIAIGYRKLSEGQFSFNESNDVLFATGAALRTVFKGHEHRLKGFSAGKKNSPTLKAGNEIAKALEYYNKNAPHKAINILEKLLSTLKSNSFDKAFTESFLGKLKVSIAETDKEKLSSIKHFETAVELELLNWEEQWATRAIIGDIYMITGEYKKYLVHVAEILSDSELGKRLVPEPTLQNIISTFGNEPKPMPTIL